MEDELEYSAADMASAAAGGWRDGQRAAAEAAQSAPAVEREAFEAWYERTFGARAFAQNVDGSYADELTEMQWAGWQARAAWQRTQAAGVPEGWCPVPVDPTPKMLRAGVLESVGALRVYYAMLAAAPAQPAVRQEPVAWLIDWPDEPELGYYFSDEQNEHARSRPLYTTPPGDEVQRLREPTGAMVQAACAAFRMDTSPMQAMYEALRAALAASAGQEVE